jgi:hypothetical protein
MKIAVAQQVLGLGGGNVTNAKASGTDLSCGSVYLSIQIKNPRGNTEEKLSDYYLCLALGG